MPFASYKNLAMTIQAFELTYQETDFVIESALSLNDRFKERFQILLREGVVDNSESAICENLIAPVLTETWYHYRQDLLLWSHQALFYNEDLSGVPDYILAQRSPLGKIVFDRPFCVAIEAKKDDFTAGWGQCGAEMVACQKRNQTAVKAAEKKQTKPIFGIVSNGKIWEFAKLRDRALTKNIKPYRVSDLDELFAAVNYVFQQAQLATHAAPTSD